MPHPPASMRVFLVLISAGILAGCATTRVSNVTRSEAAPTPPDTIIVDVTYAPTGVAKEDEAGRWTAARIGRDLTQRLRKAGFNVTDMLHAPPGGSTALLSVAISATDRGNMLKRMTIGFGAGRATLSASVRFSLDTAMSPQLGFDGAAWTQSRPGLIVPVGVGLAASGGVGLIPVAANGTLGLREGLGRAVVRFDKALIKQLKRGYYEARWTWPKSIPHEAQIADAG